MDYYSNHRHDLIRLIPPAVKRLLDVGCGPGHTGRICKQKGIEVYGVEIVPEVADLARQVLDGVVCADLEISDLPWSNFDCILCGDVLEHMRDPWSMLLRMKKMLSPEGIIIASIPNLAHWTVIKKLLTDRFEYEDRGILDKTHLRFFTRSTIIKMFEDCGYRAKISGENSTRGREDKIIQSLSLGKLKHCSVVQYIVTAIPA